jgi:DNA polymerase-3 subunit gamma/tau
MALSTPLVNKYRPSNLTEVIGQPIVVKAFTNAFKFKNLHHAYILAGNYGCGKTTVARIIAAMENCVKGPTLNPCGKCKNCKEILAGTSFDVKEINAASNRGIDDIRQLQKEIYQCPIECRTKYIIIDEAHSLTGQAAEASLKMIEEPPSRVRFILATTDAHKIIDTIHSRCISWKFNKVSWTELYNHIKEISVKENIECEDAALKMMARASKGSVRNSLQNLQTVIEYTGESKITVQDTQDALGVVDDKLYFDLMDAIINNNPSECYSIINYMLKDGKEIGIILNGINNHIGHLIKIRLCKKDVSQFSYSEEEFKRYCDQSDGVLGPALLAMMRLMREISFGINFNLDPQTQLECFAADSIFQVKQDNIRKKGNN